MINPPASLYCSQPIKDPILTGYLSFLGPIIAFLLFHPRKDLVAVVIITLTGPSSTLSISNFMQFSPVSLSPSASPSCSSCSIVQPWSPTDVPGAPMPPSPSGLFTAIGPDAPPVEGMSPSFSSPPLNSTYRHRSTPPDPSVLQISSPCTTHTHPLLRILSAIQSALSLLNLSARLSV